MMTDWSLSPQHADIEERIRTGSQLICALGILGAILYYLRSALIPLVLALALKHLLQPIITALSVRPLVCFGRVYLSRPLACETRRRGKRLQSFQDAACRLQLPRSAAIIVSLLLAFMTLGILGIIIADSVQVFSDRSAVYEDRLAKLLTQLLGWIKSMTWRACP